MTRYLRYESDAHLFIMPNLKGRGNFDVGGVVKHITVYVEVTCYQVITILKIFVAFQITYTRIYRASTGSESLSCLSLTM